MFIFLIKVVSGQSHKYSKVLIYSRNIDIALVRDDSRVVIYPHRASKRLATGLIGENIEMNKNETRNGFLCNQKRRQIPTNR